MQVQVQWWSRSPHQGSGIAAGIWFLQVMGMVGFGCRVRFGIILVCFLRGSPFHSQGLLRAAGFIPVWRLMFNLRPIPRVPLLFQDIARFAEF